MPRPRHLSVAEPLNLYDVIFDGLDPNRSPVPGLLYDLKQGQRRVFEENTTVGMTELTNMLIPGQVFDDETFYIQNIYARTNLLPGAGLDEWAHATTCGLEIGCMWKARFSLFDLLRRPQTAEIPKSAIHPESWLSTVDAVTREALTAYMREKGERKGLFDLPIAEQDAWIAVGFAMAKLVDPHPVFIIPARQSFRVRVDTNRDAFETFCEKVNAAGLDDASQPRPRAWIHLQGFKRRDVA